MNFVGYQYRRENPDVGLVAMSEDDYEQVEAEGDVD
jgi:hypothetical protein